MKKRNIVDLAIDHVIGRFGPGIQGRKNRPLIYVIAKENEKLFSRFMRAMPRIGKGGERTWAWVLDLTQVDFPDDGKGRDKFLDGIDNMSNYFRESRAAGMVKINGRDVVELNGRQWGRIVKNFELKDIHLSLDKFAKGNAYGKLGGEKEREKVSRTIWNTLEKRITSGKRLVGHMKCHYRHNEFILTLDGGYGGLTKESKEWIGRLKNSPVDKFKVLQKSGCEKNNELLTGEMEGMDKQLIDKEGKWPGWRESNTIFVTLEKKATLL